MADGTFALALVLLSFGEATGQDCDAPIFCLPEKTEDVARLAISTGPVLPRIAEDGAELYLRFDPATRYGSIGTAYGISIGNGGETWVGGGLTYDIWNDSQISAQLHFMPGIYQQGRGLDLGGPIEFRSGISVGLETDQGWRIGLKYDHKSNGSIYNRNPGIETVQLFVSVPLGSSN